MNNSQGPPLNYPSSPPPTFKPYRTPNFSRNESPRFRPPAYGAEGAPPLYQEAANIEEENGFKAKKIAVIRILSSIFIAVIIALIVAGVIGKITTMKKHEQDLKNRWVVSCNFFIGMSEIKLIMISPATTDSPTKAVPKV